MVCGEESIFGYKNERYQEMKHLFYRFNPHFKIYILYGERPKEPLAVIKQ